MPSATFQELFDLLSLDENYAAQRVFAFLVAAIG